MTNATETLMEFPCEVPIKVMGRNSDDFRGIMLAAVEAHLGPVSPDCVAERPSRAGHFISLTITIHVDTHDTLRRVYSALHATGRVLYAL
jgi:hypothetical protein